MNFHHTSAIFSSPVRYILLVSLLSLFFICCSEDDTTEPATEPELTTHHLQPNANHMILGEVTGTSGEANGSIWDLVDRPGGGYVFRGYYQSHWVIGALDNTGQIDWFRRTFYRTSGLAVSPDDVPNLAGLIFVSGNRDANDDGRYDTGVFTVVDQNGNLVDEMVWEDPSNALRFDDVIFDGAKTDSLQFLAVGGQSGGDNIYHPLVVTITLSPDTTLHKGDRYDYAAISNVRFWEVIHNPSPAKTGYFATGGRYLANGDRDHSMVFLIDDSKQIEWQQDLETGTGMSNNIHLSFNSAATEDTIYCMGYTDVNRTGSSGSYWDGGVIAAVSPHGQVFWIRTYDVSDWSDRLRDCQLVNGVLYAAGQYALYERNGSYFGYGWLAKIDPRTGDITSSHWFGDNRWYSQINCVSVAGHSARLGGYTRLMEEDGDYRHWFVDFDITGSSAAAQNHTEYRPKSTPADRPVVLDGENRSRGRE